MCIVSLDIVVIPFAVDVHSYWTLAAKNIEKGGKKQSKGVS